MHMFGWLKDWAIVAAGAAAMVWIFVKNLKLHVHGPMPAAVTTLGVVVAAPVLVSFIYHTAGKYRTCVRRLGGRHTLRGVAMMFRLRFRQPRLEFFSLTPIVGDVVPFAFCAGVYAIVPYPAIAAPLALAFALIQLTLTADRLLPPTWLFLGQSSFDSIGAFYTLRHMWGITGINLLDGVPEKGRVFYEAEGNHRGSAFYDPKRPREWSLRIRPQYREDAVQELIDYAPITVIDVYEDTAITRPRRVDTTWFLVGEQGLPAALEGIVPPDRVASLQHAGPDQFELRGPSGRIDP